VIRLDLIRRSTIAEEVAAATGVAQGGTALNFQPATASASAPTAPAQPFARTGKPTIDFEAVRAGVRTIIETTIVDLSAGHSYAAGTQVVLAIQGTAFMIDKGTDVGIAQLHIQDQSIPAANSVNVFPGDAYNNVPFTFIVIENLAQPGKVLRIHYGTDIVFLPGLGGNVLFTGGVAITQTKSGAPANGDVDSDGNFAFENSGQIAALAANFQFIGVVNPTGSGKRIYVDALNIVSSAADVLFVRDGNDTNGLQFGAVARSVAQKSAAGVAGIGAIFTGNSGSGNMTGSSGNPRAIHGVAANITTRVVFTRPHILDAGRGLFVVSGAVNLGLFVSEEHREY